MKKRIAGFMLLLLLVAAILFYNFYLGEDFLKNKLGFESGLLINKHSNSFFSFYVIIGGLVFVILLLFLIGFLKKHYY